MRVTRLVLRVTKHHIISTTLKASSCKTHYETIIEIKLILMDFCTSFFFYIYTYIFMTPVDFGR